MSFRVNIVCLNSQYVHSSLAPWCLLAGVRAYGENQVCAQVTEGTVNEKEETLLERIGGEEWDLVGFCCYLWNVKLVASLCRRLKERHPSCRIVLGGPEVGFTPGESLQEIPWADFVLSGAGEESFALLCNCLARQETPRGVPGLTSREFSNPSRDLKDPPSPYTKEYFDALGGRMAYLETMRGCPYSCAFCLSGRKEPLVFFPLERVKEELLLLCNSGTRTVKLVDRSFNADPKRAGEIVSFLLSCREQGKIPPDLCIHFEIEAMTLSDELAVLFCSAPAGMFRLEVGVQSLNSETLRAINRKEEVALLQRRIGVLTAAKNLIVHADLILGLPHEGMREFRQSFNGLFALAPQEIQVGFLKVLKGTPMRDEARYPCVFSPDPPYEVISTPWLSGEEILALKRFAQGVEKIFNSGRFLFTLGLALPLFETPFDLFWAFANESLPENQSLDHYTDALYFFLLFHGAEARELRDCLVKDRLACCADRLSPALKEADQQRLHPKKRLEQRVGKAVGRRGAAVLYGENKIVFCDYDGGRFCRKNPRTGRYRLFYLPL